MHHQRPLHRLIHIALSMLVCGCSAKPEKIPLSPLAGRASAWTLDNAAGTTGNLDEPDIDTDAGPEVCETVQLVASPQPPDMMIVLDRSSSMEEGGRWRPSVSAVRSITQKLERQVRFGLALFPSAGLGGSGSLNRWLSCLSAPDRQQCLDDLDAADSGGLLCSRGEIVVPVADRNAAAIADALDGVRPGGGTPTADTLRKLVDSYALAGLEPDAEIHARYVLLVTDGAPTCPAGNGTETTPPDVDATNAAIELLGEHHARTYVIGYDTTGPGNEMLSSVLDGFAMRGGTGDTKHRPVEDEASLLGEIQTIASSIASCDFSLDKAPSRPDFVLVQLDGQQLNLDATDGWRLVGDRTIQLVGAACERFRDGTHSVSAEIRCAIVEPS